MAMISYSQNFEDVILQRVFADVQAGCFVDVGACNPVNDNNTIALYQKGWRGVCIDPLGSLEVWQSTRPQDIFVNVAIGANAGETTFHIFEKYLQICTTSPETVEHWARHGVHPERSQTVPMLTLDMVIEQHLKDRPLHLLAIDVEGMEREVLQGVTLARHQPWVVVIEATVPGTRDPSHAAWAPLLLDAGYSMVYFDGLNQFYLAAAHPELAERFTLPPNRWDRFTMAKEVEQQRRIASLEQTVADLQAQLALRANG